MRVLVVVVIEGDVVTLWVGHGEFDHVETVAIANRAVNGRSPDADISPRPISTHLDRPTSIFPIGLTQLSLQNLA